MARPLKNGVDYFPLDVILDDKFELIEAEFGLVGFAVVVKLFQKIYGQQGYYCEWNDEVALLFGKRNGLGSNAVSEIVSASIRRGIFNEDMYMRHHILTSAGIQRRYIEAAARRRGAVLEEAYLLLNYAEIPENVNINRVNVNNNSINACNNPQSKVKETKLNQTKLNDIKLKDEDSAADDGDSLKTYLEQNLWRMSPGNWEALRELMANGITDALVRHAVDIATGRGKYSWGYVQSILNRWITEGVRTVGDAKARHAEYVHKLSEKYGSKPNPALNYDQRQYTDSDFGDDFFIDLGKEYGDEKERTGDFAKQSSGSAPVEIENFPAAGRVRQAARDCYKEDDEDGKT